MERRLGIFGGTTEGRLLAEACIKRGIPVLVSVATGYGSGLLGADPLLTVHTGCMDAVQMGRWMRGNDLADVVDATHPFAREASANIKKACREAGVSYHRLSREGCGTGWDRCDSGRDIRKTGSDKVLWVGSVEAAALFLEKEMAAHPERKALVTTGSKELFYFARITGVEERVYARVLPSAEGIAACTKIGLKGSHIMAMQGPFSYEMNLAMLQAAGVSYLVTKESGRAGGFQEKLDAALKLGCTVIVVGRPEEDGEQGKSLEELVTWAEEVYGDAAYGNAAVLQRAPDHPCAREIILLGIGTGGLEQMTIGGIRALLRSDAILGASRMVESCRAMLEELKAEDPGAERAFCITYRPEEMLAWLSAHPEVRRPVAVYSGDVGFYSGTKKLEELAARQREPIICRRIPGISSMAYLAAKLGKSWEDVGILSLHGRKEPEDWELSHRKEWVLLLDGTARLRQVCQRLIKEGWEHAMIWVGQRLSYADEEITSGTPGELMDEEIDGLSVAWIMLEGGEGQIMRKFHRD